MPTYNLNGGQVMVAISGKILDENYTKLLFSRPDLDLNTVFLLDKVQKLIGIDKESANILRKKALIEGRYPQIYVAAEVAEQVDKKQEYIKNRAFDDDYYKDMILQFLKKYNQASFNEIFKLLDDKLSDVLDESQKKRKIKYLLMQLKSGNKIISEGNTRSAIWKLK